MTTATEAHDSLTCDLGPDGQPCTMCWWANEAGYMSRDELAPPSNFESVASGGRVASLATIRAALFDVLDAGCNCDSSEKHPWELDEDPNDKDVTEEIVDRQRQRFVDTVIERIAQLQRPPHNFDSKSTNYQSGYADGWAAAHTATLREQNADLREMLRLAQVRKGEQ